MLKPAYLEVSSKMRKASTEKQIVPFICVPLSFNNTLKVLSLFVVRNKIKYCINTIVANISLSRRQERAPRFKADCGEVSATAKIYS